MVKSKQKSGEHTAYDLTFEYLANAQCVAIMLSLAVTRYRPQTFRFMAH